MTFNRNIAVCLVSMLTLVGCTGGAELTSPIETTIKSLKSLGIQGRFCTDPVPSPQETDVKIIHLVDGSQSMIDNNPTYLDGSGQPTNDLIEAIKVLDSEIIDACNQGFPNVYQMFMTYAGLTQVLSSPAFSQCSLQPTTVYQTYLGILGGPTNFGTAMVALKNEIEQDIQNSYVSTGLSDTRRVIYKIILSNGGPPDNGFPGQQPDEESAFILGLWQEVVNMVSLYSFADLSLDVYLFKGQDLVQGTPQSIQLLNDLRDLLTSMLDIVPGKYSEVDTTALANQEFAFDFPNLYALFSPYQISQVVAKNRSAPMNFNGGTVNFDVDSDGDGLSDVQEGALGGNPLEVDSDGDGCTDFGEYFLGLDLAVADCPANTNEFNDDDGDGAITATELILGTNPFDPDSDNDGITDFDELKNQLNPNDPTDVVGDLDSDGVQNKTEFIKGWDLLNGNPQEASAFEVLYNVTTGALEEDGSYCIDMTVDNVAVRDTLTGTNLVDVMILFTNNFNVDGIATHRVEIGVANNEIQGSSGSVITENDWTVFK